MGKPYLLTKDIKMIDRNILNIINTELDSINRLYDFSLSSKKITPEIVLAIIKQESNFNTWATRYERGFYMRYIKPLRAKGAKLTYGTQVSLDTEANSRATSWGLMQIMGQVARERGFSEPFLSQLCDPRFGIKLGCSHLAFMLQTYKHLDDAISAYNQGNNRKRIVTLADGKPTRIYVNKPYVDSVKLKISMYKTKLTTGEINE